MDQEVTQHPPEHVTALRRKQGSRKDHSTTRARPLQSRWINAPGQSVVKPVRKLKRCGDGGEQPGQTCFVEERRRRRANARSLMFLESRFRPCSRPPHPRKPFKYDSAYANDLVPPGNSEKIPELQYALNLFRAQRTIPVTSSSTAWSHRSRRARSTTALVPRLISQAALRGLKAAHVYFKSAARWVRSAAFSRGRVSPTSRSRGRVGGDDQCWPTSSRDSSSEILTARSPTKSRVRTGALLASKKANMVSEWKLVSAKKGDGFWIHQKISFSKGNRFHVTLRIFGPTILFQYVN